MRKMPVILMVPAATLAWNLLCLIAPGADEESLTDDEAMYEALRGETVPESKDANPTEQKSTGPRMPTLRSQGPSKLAAANDSGPFFLVATDQFFGDDTYQIMTTDEMKKVKDELRNESTKIRAAHRMAEKEWAATEQDAYPYPCPKARRAQPRTRYLDREKAEEKLDELLALRESEERKLLRAKKKELKNITERRKKIILAGRDREKKMSELFLTNLDKLVKGEDPSIQKKATEGTSEPAKKAADAPVDLL